MYLIWLVSLAMIEVLQYLLRSRAVLHLASSHTKIVNFADTQEEKIDYQWNITDGRRSCVLGNQKHIEMRCVAFQLQQHWQINMQICFEK